MLINETQMNHLLCVLDTAICHNSYGEIEEYADDKWVKKFMNRIRNDKNYNRWLKINRKRNKYVG